MRLSGERARRWRALLLLAMLVVGAHTSPLFNPSRSRRVRQAQSQELAQTLGEGPMLDDLIVFGPELEQQGPRDKRTVKQVINFLFWKINTLLQLKTRLLFRISENQRLAGSRTTTPPPAIEEDDVPEFDSNRVMLDIPGELFGTTFSLVTDVSKIVGDVILNTARRTQRFIENLKPAIAKTLGYKISVFTGGSSTSTSTGEEEDAASSTS